MRSGASSPPCRSRNDKGTCGRRASWFDAPLHGWAAFVKTLVLRAGVLDGATGWQVAEYNRRYAEAKWRRLADHSREQRATST